MAPTWSHRPAAQQTTGLRWLGSLLGLVSLVAGIPTALVVCHVVPPLAQLGRLFAHPSVAAHYLNGSVTDGVVTKSIAGAAWIVWLWLFACVLVETVAAIRGRPALHLPASRHIQSLTTALVGASLAILPLGRDGLPMRLYAAPAAIHATAGPGRVESRADRKMTLSGRAEELSRKTSQDTVVALVDDRVVSAMSEPVYVVRSGDTLWSIAEHELGSPLRWSAIANLNYGRLQPDGGRLTDAHWIYPGWVLELPSSPTVSPASAVVKQLPISAADVRDATDIHHGPSAQPLEADSRVHEGRSGGDSSNEESVRSSGLENAGSKTGQHPTSPAPVGAVGYGVLGAGVLALLEGMRRVQRRHRRTGLRIALPAEDVMALERRLRVSSDPEGATFIDLGLRALVIKSLRCEMTPPQAALVRLGETALEIVLDPGSIYRTPPEPFTSDPDERSWFLSRGHSTVQALQQDSEVVHMDAPFPALVSIGRDERGLALVDLEQAACVDVTGTNSEGILGAIAIELATAKWADQVELVLVGFDHALDALERINHVPAISDVLPKALRRVRERTALLASVGCHANWEIRWAEGGDSWDLCVVICARSAVEADRDGATSLARIAGSGGFGLAVVLGADTGAARWHITADEGRVALKNKDVDTSFSSQPVDPQFSTGVASLVEVAGQLEGVLPTDPPYDRLLTVPPDSEPRGVWDPEESLVKGGDEADGSEPSPRSRDCPEVEVRVLGSIEIVGAARPFTRAWAVELIVYLVMHRSGATSEQWATALWPDRVMAAASLHSTASAARRSLGVSVSGDDHLPRGHGRLQLGPSVGSDWMELAELSERPDPESWRLALELIRGRPFEGLRAPDWVLLEGIAASVEAVVVDLASRYAEHCLSVGDPSGAEWSARQGLRVSAYDERLYRILLRGRRTRRGTRRGSSRLWLNSFDSSPRTSSPTTPFTRRRSNSTDLCLDARRRP